MPLSCRHLAGLICLLAPALGACSASLPRRGESQGPFGGADPASPLAEGAGWVWPLLAGALLGGLAVWLARRWLLRRGLRGRGALDAGDLGKVEAALRLLEAAIASLPRRGVVIRLADWLARRRPEE